MSWQAQASGKGASGVSKTTDHYSGNYAIMLQTQSSGSNGGAAQVTTGRMSNNNGPQGGLPYTKMTDTLTGYYKYTTSGTDSGQIFVNLSKSGNPVGGNIYHCVATTAWTYFQIPFSASITPDSIRVDLISSSWTSAVTGSTLYVDKMQLKSQPLSINHVTSAAGNVSTYPNPVDGVLHINTGNYFMGNIALRLFDINGKVVLQKNYNADNPDIAIPVSQFAKGIYFYELRNNDLIIRDKFVKQ
ncbi:MAG: T9SS type A sorting domain-containing protein [Taibaiella sp.]|nr:T9SS type A sorting domain-containing protein [Taibaiella sp.]